MDFKFIKCWWCATAIIHILPDICVLTKSFLLLCQSLSLAPWRQSSVMPHIHHPSRCGHWRFCCEQAASVMWQSRNSSNQCPPRTHAHTHAMLSHTPGTTVPQQTRICGTIKHCINHRGRQWGRSISSSHAGSQHSCCILLELHSVLQNYHNIVRKGRRNQETFDSMSHLSSVAILQRLLCCSHFVSPPFSTLLGFSWGCQMARVKPPTPTVPPHHLWPFG